MKTIKNLIALGTLALVFVAANQAHAYVPGVWDPQPVNYNRGPAFIKLDTYETAAEQPPRVSAPNTNTNTNTNTNSNVNTASAQTAKTTRTSYNSSQPAVQYSNTSYDTSNFPPAVTVDSANPYNNNLTALSVQGSGGFMPSSIWQWFLVVLLIFAIIVIARMFSRRTPNEIHTHTATAH